MKKLLLLFTLLFSVIGFSQALEDGTYASTVYTTDYSKKADFTFTAFTGSTSGTIVVDIEGHDPALKKTINYANGTTTTWINSGGSWSESQTFTFTKDVNTGKIYLHWLRVVQNAGQEPWYVFCIGEVTKQ